ncbi:hypothetical protein K438DRAFT_2165600 [Mycena galopus ATCC 62051]|nr:hypothetical protein K438DRAFT_2165600 [Mycena galopus ATCC 62051]
MAQVTEAPRTQSWPQISNPAALPQALAASSRPHAVSHIKFLATRARAPAVTSPKPRKSTLRGKQCSPVESLFLIACSSSGAAACLEPIRVPLPPLVSAAPNSSVHTTHDNEDVWVDEDELTVIAEDDREDDGLLTPVPTSAWRFGSTQPPSLQRDLPSAACVKLMRELRNAVVTALAVCVSCYSDPSSCLVLSAPPNCIHPTQPNLHHARAQLS